MKKIFIFLFLTHAFFCQAQITIPVKTFRTITANPIALVAFDPFGKLIGADSEGYLLVFDIKTGSLQKILRAHEQKINGISFSPDGKSMATAGADVKMFLWSYPDGVKTNTIDIKAQTNFITYTTDGKSLFFSNDSAFYKMSTVDNNIIEVYRAYKITDGLVSKDNRYFVFGMGSNVSLLDLNKKSRFKKVKCCSGSTTTAVDFAKPGIAACHCEDGTINMVDAISGKKLWSLQGEKGPGKLAFSNNGKFLVSYGYGNDVQVWRVSNQKMIDSLKGDTATMEAVAFSPDDKYLATGSDDGTIRLWLIEDFENEQPGIQVSIKTDEQKIAESEIPATVKFEDRNVENQNTLDVSSETMEIFVWDNENVDGDTISLNFNGEWILREYSLTKTRKKLTLTLKPGQNELILFAHNLGKDAPNTAAISFMEGNKERTLTLNSDLNNCGAINFFYEK